MAAITPYKNIPNFTQNIPNKVVDALSNGLPILSTLHGEVEFLLKKYNAGFTYNNENELYMAINELLSSKETILTMSENAKKLYHDKFDFEKNYNELVMNLKTIANSNG